MPQENRETIVSDIQDNDFKSGQTYEEYAKNLEKIKEYILEGDVMQVGYSRRISISFTADPLHLYRAIRYINPSPYLYF